MAQQQPSTESAPNKPHDADEIVHTPTPHRARWIMGILLLITILTTFTVGDEIVKLMTGQSRNSAYARWTHPTLGEQSISGDEWQACLRSVGKLYEILGFREADNDHKQEVAQTLIVGQLAREAGIAVTDEELGQFILMRFGSATNYRMTMPRYRTSTTEFEEALRHQFEVQRYMALMTGAWNTPDIAEIEKSWKTQHQEYAFDYVELPLESMQDEARKDAIPDEAVQKYLDDLPLPKKDSFKTKEKIAAEVAGLSYEGAATDKLLAKFPPPTDEAELEKKAKDYFDAFGARRFKGKTYDDVKQQARSEALAYGALQAWLKDLRAREEQGATIDFGVEAEGLGLVFQRVMSPLELIAWQATKPAPWLGMQTPAMLFGNATDAVAGKFYTSVIVDETSFVLPRISTKEEPVMPPFEELKNRLLDEMWNKRAKELALAKLEGLRDQFGARPAAVEGQPPAPWLPEVEEAKFYEVARGAALEAKLRDFTERVQPMTAEPPAPVDIFLRTQAALYSAKPGAVPAAATDFEGKRAYLVRVRGARDPDPARMKPADFANVSMGARNAEEAEFRQRAFSLAALQSRYGLSFREKAGSN